MNDFGHMCVGASMAHFGFCRWKTGLFFLVLAVVCFLIAQRRKQYIEDAKRVEQEVEAVRARSRSA